MPKATCCDDGEHCCPNDLPVCDTANGRCLPPSFAAGAAGAMRSVPWATKTPAVRKTAAFYGKGRFAKGRQGAKFIGEQAGGLPVAAS
jgi:KDEL-tailed cysteine endopeptidase